MKGIKAENYFSFYQTAIDYITNNELDVFLIYIFYKTTKKGGGQVHYLAKKHVDADGHMSRGVGGTVAIVAAHKSRNKINNVFKRPT